MKCPIDDASDGWKPLACSIGVIVTFRSEVPAIAHHCPCSQILKAVALCLASRKHTNELLARPRHGTIIASGRIDPLREE
jgi:hypothetical protein